MIIITFFLPLSPEEASLLLPKAHLSAYLLETTALYLLWDCPFDYSPILSISNLSFSLNFFQQHTNMCYYSQVFNPFWIWFLSF